MKKQAAKAAKSLAGRRGRPSKGGIKDPTEPSTRDQAWYHEWAVNHRRQVDIAKKARVARSTVCRAIQDVDQWMRLQLFDDIVSYRIRQSEMLEEAISKCLKKFDDTSDVAYMEEARKLAADFRKIWGVDKPQKLEITGDDEGLERVAGMTRADALRQQAKALIQAAEGVNEPGSEPGSSGDVGSEGGNASDGESS